MEVKGIFIIYTSHKGKTNGNHRRHKPGTYPGMLWKAWHKARLVAYILSCTRTSQLRALETNPETLLAHERCRLAAARHAAVCLAEAGWNKHLIQAWFQGMNPMLNDVAPARVLRDRVDEKNASAEVQQAARHSAHNG